MTSTIEKLFTRAERPGVKECSNCMYWLGPGTVRCSNRRDILSCGACASFEEYKKPDEDLLWLFKIIEENYWEISKKASTVVNDDTIMWRTKKDESKRADKNYTDNTESE